MANLSEQESWIDGIYQLETSDPVVAGPGGISNRQAEQLASRTAYLKKMQENTGESLQKHLTASDPHSQYAPKASPAFTGTPTAPTTAQTANNTQIATTAFVKTAIAALINGSPAALDTLQELANALGNDPNFSTTILNAIAEVKTDAASKLNAHASTLDAHPQYAPKASPTFTGTPTAPTAGAAANDTQIATTAFVKAAIAALVNGSPAALDTLQELANALGNDPNFSTTVLNALAGKLAKDQNGADIPDKSKFLSTLVYRGELVNGGMFAACNQTGVYRVAISDGNTVTDMPKNIRGEMLYSYGFLFINEIGGIHSQMYLPHRGPVATRQAWNGVYSLGWNVMLDGLTNKPSATDIGAFPLGFTGTVNNSDVAWNANSGVYQAQRPTDSQMIVHFNGGAGSCPSLQFLASYGNGGLSYRTARDHYGFEHEWETFYTTKFKPSASTIGALSASELAGIPLPFPGAVAPTGWLKCNGQTFNKTLYPVLASRYPSGVLPDLRGEFVRGWDDGRGVDAGRALLSHQSDELRAHTHGGVPLLRNDTDRGGGSSNFSVDDIGTTSTTGGTETRPRNIAFNYIVRAA
ncbi:phage tail protein [Pectobacterium sp. CFBP8739]|uniref:phage tail protein n=1 Tax=Pectobacterium sp. CFBP8739 TaxID=2748908 RepID=UPI0015DF5A78|nr:phage tail protein [Pectobacterium sp. CFBP8739]MBA0167242.1 tail fiber protein [Pectobacterium sp. CFBP8739]